MRLVGGRTVNTRLWPTIGHVRWWHRLLGWHDVRCRCCGEICGASTGGSTCWCADCSGIYALVGIL